MKLLAGEITLFLLSCPPPPLSPTLPSPPHPQFLSPYNRYSLCSPRWPQTQDPPGPSLPQMLGGQVHTTIPSSMTLVFFFKPIEM